MKLTAVGQYKIRYILAICGADVPGPIPIKFGVRVAPHDIIKISIFL